MNGTAKDEWWHVDVNRVKSQRRGRHVGDNLQEGKPKTELHQYKGATCSKVGKIIDSLERKKGTKAKCFVATRFHFTV